MKNIMDFLTKKQSGQKISMITCYDHWSAKIINKSDIDCILVGDSAAMVMHGQPTTLNISVEQMAFHCLAVVRGAPDKFIVGDMPFMSYRKSLSDNMTAVEQIMKTGVHAIKLEGAPGNIDLIKHIVQSGVPVMGHIGLTPQSIHQMGGFRVQGRDGEQARILKEQALALQEAGCFAMVFELIPAQLAQNITQSLQIPTIGIGAGPHCDGQVLVLQDMLGLNEGFNPKFLKTYLDGATLISEALNQYHEEVTSEKFPTEKESYS